MLSGEGKEKCEKPTRGLISKKTTLHVQHTFFVHFFAVVLHDYVKRPETSWLHVLWRKCRTCSCSLFSPPLIFSLVAARIFHFLTAATNSCCSSNRKWLLISRSCSPSLFFSLSFAGLLPIFSFSLSFSFSIDCLYFTRRGWLCDFPQKHQVAFG